MREERCGTEGSGQNCAHAVLPSNNFRSGHRWSLLNAHELVAKGMRFTLEIAEDSITILLFVGVLTRIDIPRTIAQQAIDQPGELVSSR